MRALTHCLFPFVTLASVSAQTTWTVPVGQEIQPVIDAAAPGDTIQLSGGLHGGFNLTKGLTIRGADVGALVTTGPNYPADATCTVQIPPGQYARFVETVHITHPTLYTSGYIEVLAGRVSFVNCEMRGGANHPAITGPSAGLRVAAGAQVELQGCKLTGTFGSPGLRCEQADVVAVDCVFEGSDPWTVPFDSFQYAGNAGILLDGGVLHIARSVVRGGDGWSHFCGPVACTESGFPGLRVLDGRAFIVDSEIRGGSVGSQTAIETITHVATARTTFGGTRVGPVTDDPTLLGVRPIPREVQPGTTEAFAILGAPAMPTLVLLATVPSVAARADILRQPWWAPASAVPIFAGLTDSLGGFQNDVAIPNDPGLVDRTFWFHAIGGFQRPFEVAPVFSTTVR